MERIRLEIKRQPLHILLGLFLVVLIYHDLLTVPMLVAAILAATIGSIFIRKTKPKEIYKALSIVEREDDLKNMPGKGLIAYLVGALIALILFKKEIAMAAMIILALGDSFSRLIGPFGKIKHPFNDARFLEGVIAGIAAASLGAMLFVKPAEAITASFITMLLEGIELKLFNHKIDDNITIPLIAGVIISIMRIL
ncbi:MAG: hypothetical protein KKC75_00120 [Nanoarchaeota archaeon]|nr:hypothetical protein [Nanoarchaeota archaeon]MBU1005553.1 hypothetical protein [Nanoarchaeota archaeon]MBU1946042.1 hypothetical protein [Nanoarchaeota archaeon]